MGGEVAGLRHAAVREARRLRRARHRRATGRLLVEGPHAVAEAVDHLERVFVSSDPAGDLSQVLDVCRAREVEVVAVAPHVLDALTDAVTPQGVVAVARRPATGPPSLAGARLVVVIDGVGEPGNVGALVRIADAAGADAVVLTAGSADPGNAKAVRASAGSLFHLPVVDGLTVDDVVAHVRAHGLRLVVSDAGTGRPYDAVSLIAPSAIVFGSEAHGVSADLRRHADAVVTVPISAGERRGWSGRAESLNVAAAAAVVCFEARRQRTSAATP